MVGAGFPRVERKVLRPVHACMGELEIAGGGVMCLSETDVGTMQVFYDVSKAEAQGCFGVNPKIWGEPEYAMLIEMLATALCADKGKWGT